jgi:hypothetical protein
MHLTEEQKQILRQAYGDYLAGPADPVMDFDMRDLSKKFEILPMLHDFGYCLAIKLLTESLSPCPGSLHVN